MKKTPHVPQMERGIYSVSRSKDSELPVGAESVEAPPVKRNKFRAPLQSQPLTFNFQLSTFNFQLFASRCR